MSRRHVIVGSGIAALSAAEAIRQAEPRATITVVGMEPAGFYSRPGLAYYLTEELPAQQLALRTEQELAALRLERIVGRATSLVPARHLLYLEDGRALRYDRLLLATGAASIPPDFPGAGLEGVMHLDGLADAEGLVQRIGSTRAAVVVGGGSTALELVEGFAARGLETHYLMRGERYWAKVLDRVESAIVEARLLAGGVHLYRHTGIREVLGQDGRVAGVSTTTGHHLPAEIVAVAVGVRPRLALAQGAGLTLDRGIVTSECLETSAADVYAAGDVAQVYDPVTRTAQLDTLWASAQAQGRIAGLNMAGLRLAYRTRPALNVTRLGGITTTIVGTVGAGDDPDLLTLTRGQSERWLTDPEAWSVGGARRGQRLRVVVSGRAIVGAVIMGDQALSTPLAHLIGEQVDISALRPALGAEPEAALDLLLDFCHAHVRDRTASHG